MNPAIPEERLKINILLVDDRKENLTALKAILTDPTYNLIFASSGAEALKSVLRHDLALILLDVFMAEMDGYEVAAMIKSREKSRHIPIIFLTAMARDVDHIFKAYSIGAVDYIQKPLEPQIVRAKVAVFAELYRNKLRIKRQQAQLWQSELREKEYQLQLVKRAAEEKFQDLVEGISSGFVWSADPASLTFSYVSPRASDILGYPPRRWSEEKGFWVNHLHPADRDEVLSVFNSAQKGRDLEIEHRFMTPDGRAVWLHTGVRLARMGEGMGHELRGLSVDITHLKDVEEALRQLIRSRDEFLSIASHELKTPLTPLKLQVQMLMRALERKDDRVLAKENISRTLKLWNRQLDRLSSLVEDLLDVSRITSGRFTIQREEMDLARSVREILERYRGELAQAGCEATLTGAASATGRWDRCRIEQVVVNLLTNAMKYGEGKPIQVSLECDERKATLSVRDFGIGIPEENRERIFERFERAVPAASFGGLGLGLYIVRRIVEEHGGSIRVESEVRNGATFIVELPRATESVPEAEVA